MSRLDITHDVEYPESDGRPMGETDLHINWMIRIRDQLRYRYRDQRVYVGCDLLLYYEQGDPKRFVVPDHFVIKDSDPGMRRTFKVWEEGKTPDVVFEVTSKSTRREDTRTKPLIYAQLGVKEYFLFDPTLDYLEPSLQGFRLQGGTYARIESDRSGALACDELDLLLRLDGDGKLLLIDARTGRLLLTEAEAEREARFAAEARAEAAEAELRRLRQG